MRPQRRTSSDERSKTFSNTSVNLTTGNPEKGESEDSQSLLNQLSKDNLDLIPRSDDVSENSKDKNNNEEDLWSTGNISDCVEQLPMIDPKEDTLPTSIPSKSHSRKRQISSSIGEMESFEELKFDGNVFTSGLLKVAPELESFVLLDAIDNGPVSDETLEEGKQRADHLFNNL
ncbi:hypothetical protein B9Z55_009998 [Caenorhabditis nigoni]|uniref:Uncharacterized protein n=1 Tax=Caenorhabditis nigoni TaxID=1611254 RepID=A0A2G5UU77_9PELO|nr:hypothetical protein B9Z55_009998 [Caenorhabditis nigoni]